MQHVSMSNLAPIPQRKLLQCVRAIHPGNYCLSGDYNTKISFPSSDGARRRGRRTLCSYAWRHHSPSHNCRAAKDASSAQNTRLPQVCGDLYNLCRANISRHCRLIDDWDAVDLIKWLNLNGFDEFVKNFYDNGFTGKELFRIDIMHYTVSEMRGESSM